MKTILLIILLTACAAHAEGVKLEAGYGTCHANKSQGNTWYQDGEAHQLQLNDRCGEIGLSFDTPIRNVYFKTRYTALGQFATHADAVADDNDDASRRGKANVNPADCPIKFAADCHYKWDGSGGVSKGLLFALAWEPFQIGQVHLGGEVGLFVYQARWRETVHPIDCPGNQCWQLQIDQRTGWQRAPEFGLSARWDPFYVAVRRYELRMPGGTSNPLEPSQAPNITAGFRAPIHQFLVGVSYPF